MIPDQFMNLAKTSREGKGSFLYDWQPIHAYLPHAYLDKILVFTLGPNPYTITLSRFGKNFLIKV